MPVVMGGLVLAFLVMLLFGATDIDRTLLILIGEGLPALKPAAAWIAWLAHPLVLALPLALAAAWLVLRRDWRGGALLLAVTASGWLAVLLVRHLSADFRPDDDLRRLSGFPSLAAASATIADFAIAFLVTRYRPARGWALAAAFLFAALAGFAPLVVGRSWPSDSIGGWAFGLLWVLACLMLARHDLGDGDARPPAAAAAADQR